MDNKPKLTLLDFNNAPRQSDFRDDDRDDYRDPIVEFRRAMGERGHILSESPIPDGNWHRHGEKKEMWYIFNDDPFTGSFGSWKTGETFNWSLKNEAAMDGAELARHRAMVDRQRMAREEEAKKVAAEAREKAAKNWAEAQPVEKHPYLERKKIPSLGAKLRQGCLVIPAMDVYGTIHTYQTIDAMGGKMFLPGGAKRGHFFTIPGEGKTAFVEGFATGASVHVATGWKVVVAFDAGNLAPVIESYREANPKDELILCTDNDHTKPKNTGKENAEAIFKKLGVRFVLPTGMAGTDFNDLHTEKGVDEVKKQLFADKKYKITLADWSASRFRNVKAPEKKWLVKGTLPMNDTVMLAAMGGVGKGMLTLDLALQVAAGEEEIRSQNDYNPVPSAFGNPIVTHGPVVIFTAEDDNDELHRRIENIGKPIHDRLIVIPLPDACGPAPIVVPGKAGPEVTQLWHEIREQLMDIRPVLINFDPMASFVMADVNADPAVGQYTMGLFAHLGKEVGASVLIAHHMSKTSVRVETPDAVRSLIRGTTAIVDGARGAYVLWGARDKEAMAICQVLGIPYHRNRVVKGCLAKNNFGGDESIKTFVRSDYGLLQVADDRIRSASGDDRPLHLDVLADFLVFQADHGKPLAVSGSMGIHENREILPDMLKNLGKHTLRSLADELVEEGRIVKASARGSSLKKWLCGPGSDFDLGRGEVCPGGFGA